MLLLGIDLETTGLDPAKDQIIELGMVIWCTESKKPVKIFSELINQNAKISPEITAITGITEKDCELFGISMQEAIFAIEQYASIAEVKVAYNAEFEANFIGKIPAPFPCFYTLAWIDPQFDIQYPETIKTRKLDYLCYEHGFRNPFKHRAVFDVMAMFEIMQKYDFERILERSKSPKVDVAAMVSYDNRNQAKEAGFFWVSEEKTWKKTIKFEDFGYLQNELPFRIDIIKNYSQAKQQNLVASDDDIPF